MAMWRNWYEPEGYYEDVENQNLRELEAGLTSCDDEGNIDEYDGDDSIPWEQILPPWVMSD